MEMRRSVKPSNSNCNAAALANGQIHAEQIALASGRQLGELKSIHAMHAANHDPMMHQAKMHQQMQGKEWPDEDGIGFEFISDTNRKAKFMVTLMQTYQIV